MEWPAPSVPQLKSKLAWQSEEEWKMQIAVLGIDLGKNSCSLAGLDYAGRVVVRRRLRRESVIKFAASLPPCIVAMEACCGAHHLGRILRSQGHEVRLMSPEYVRPYVKAQKNDDRDAEAIAEAATRPTMRFVELKSEAQLAMQTLHRARDRLVGERTALINQLRAVLLERGLVVPHGRRKLEQHLAAMLDEGEGLPLSPRVRALVADMRAEWRAMWPGPKRAPPPYLLGHKYSLPLLEPEQGSYCPHGATGKMFSEGLPRAAGLGQDRLPW
jgi:transposase